MKQALLLLVAAMGVLMSGCTKVRDALPTADTAVGPAVRPITVTVYDRGRIPAEEGTMDDNRWTDWINANSPVPVKYVVIPRNDSLAKLNVLFASDNVPDVINEYNTPYRDQLYQQQQLLPLDELIDTYAPNYRELLERFPELRRIGTKPDGRLYEVGRLQGTKPAHVLLIRADWLKKLNLDVPQTAEDLFRVAKAFTEQDPDGDGKANTYGLSLAPDPGLAIDRSSFIDKMFGNVGWVVQDGKLVFDWERAAASNAFKKRLFDEGVVDRNYLTDRNGEKAKQDWLSGRLGIYAMQHALQWNPGFLHYLTLKGNVPTAEIKPIPLPESPYGRFSISYQNPLQMTTVVYRGAEDPVSAVRYLDFMAARSTALVLKYGLEGIHWRLGPNGCPVAIDKEKNSKELVYIPDLAMQTSPELLGDCNETENDFDPNVPEQQEYLDIIREARYWYESPERPIPDLAIPEHMPTLPSTLSRIHQELMEQISDIWAKAVVSGPAYTIEEALADAQAVWYRGGGRELEAWYADWYEANKDTAFLAHDIYKFLHH